MRGVRAAALAAGQRVRAACVRRVGEGFLIPRGFGVAWVRYDRQEAVCLPIPVNVIAAGVRAAWFWAKRGGVTVPGSPTEAYAAGVAAERARWMAYLEDPLG